MVINGEEVQCESRINPVLHHFDFLPPPSTATSHYNVTSIVHDRDGNVNGRSSSSTRRGRSSSSNMRLIDASEGGGKQNGKDFFSRLRQYSLERKGKMIKFFRNGDRFYPGIELCISLDRYRCIDGLYEELNRVLGVSEYLDRGVRRLLGLDGKVLRSVDELIEAGGAVCSSGDVLRKLDYNNIRACPQWKFSPSQMDAKRKDMHQRHNGVAKRQTVRAEKVISPKRIVVFLHESSIYNASKATDSPRKHLKLLLNEQTVNGGYLSLVRQMQQQFNAKYQRQAVDERNVTVSSFNHNNNNNQKTLNAAEKSAEHAHNGVVNGNSSQLPLRITACYTTEGKRCATLLDLVRGGDDNNCFIAFDEQCISLPGGREGGRESAATTSPLCDDDFILAYAEALGLDNDEVQILNEHTLTMPPTSLKVPQSAASRLNNNSQQQRITSPISNGQCGEEQTTSRMSSQRKQSNACRKRIVPVVATNHAAVSAARRPVSAQANYNDTDTTGAASSSSIQNCAEETELSQKNISDDAMERSARCDAQNQNDTATSTTNINPTKNNNTSQRRFPHHTVNLTKQPCSRKISAPVNANKYDNREHQKLSQLAHPATIAAAASRQDNNAAALKAEINNTGGDTLRPAAQQRRRQTKRPTTCTVVAASARLTHRGRAASNNPTSAIKSVKNQSQTTTAPLHVSARDAGGNHHRPITPNIRNNPSSEALPVPHRQQQLQHPVALTNKYRVLAQIGTGNFADVHLCADVYDLSRQFALKIIDKRKVLDKRNLSNECALLRKLGMHVNIVTLYEQYEFANRVYLLMELVAGGDLFNYISQAKCLSERESASLIATLMNGLHYLHSNNIVHRDVKPENLLVCCHQSVDDTTGEQHYAYAAKSLKLCDFGLAVELPKGQRLFTICGSPTYIAPEILHEAGYDYQVDVWAAGVIAYIMLAGYPPFRGDEETGQEELFGQILDARYCFDDDYWSNISDFAKDLISKILVVNPYRRLTCMGVFAHVWIQKHLEYVPHPLSDSLTSSAACANASTLSVPNISATQRVQFLPASTISNVADVSNNGFIISSPAGLLASSPHARPHTPSVWHGMEDDDTPGEFQDSVWPDNYPAGKRNRNAVAASGDLNAHVVPTSSTLVAVAKREPLATGSVASVVPDIIAPTAAVGADSVDAGEDYYCRYSDNKAGMSKRHYAPSQIINSTVDALSETSLSATPTTSSGVGHEFLTHATGDANEPFTNYEQFDETDECRANHDDSEQLIV